MVLRSSAIAGACAGLVSSVVTCPLDVVKTRLQAQEGRRRSPPAAPTIPNIPTPTSSLSPHLRPPPPAPSPAPPTYLGLRATLGNIYHNDGFRGFYRGLGPTIFGYLPTWAIYFTVYDNCKSLYPSSSASEEFINHILSAMTAGAVSTICTSPLWVVKTRFMLQSTKDTKIKPYRHTGDAFVQIFRSEGVRGFYKGLLPSLFGVSHVAVQFPLYEWFKGIAQDRRVGGEGEGGELDASTILLCSSSAKMIASVTTYPHEVLRTRLQMQPRNHPPTPGSTGATSLTRPPTSSKPTIASTIKQSVNETKNAVVEGVKGTGRYTGVIQASRTIAREEGIRGFYKGMTVNLVRTVPSSALTILTYELIMQHLSSQHDDGEG
ncbi:related to YIA6-Pvruvate transporter of the mitochondrial inner membrane [Ustilago bromivora]|uniref:Related to YIA6-Pvruvate transporter of the mitochondrial inner membrane n=1 Tax=Ustilago bromivora TaxID=307758 RepID=A0A1K0H0V3_9BASI|nr:related to YIA6-Pvruvate transporter of the mitochondrial inner membrane [Ustilago bromivora]